MRRVRYLYAAVALVLLPGFAYGAEQSMYFDGTLDRVSVEHHPDLNPATAISIEAWVRPESVSGAQTLVGKDFRTGYWLGIVNGAIRFYTNGLGTQIDGSQSVPNATWTHIAVTFDGTTRRYYIDGELDAQAFTPGFLPHNARPLGIGSEAYSPSFPTQLYELEGRLSEVRIWSKALTLDEIRKNMFRQLTRPETGLVGLWPLEGAGKDRFNRFVSTTVGALLSSAVPPTEPHDPLAIPVSGAETPVIDGVCESGEHGFSRDLRVWYDPDDLLIGEENPMEISLGADASYVYVCLDRRDLGGFGVVQVMVDADNSAGTIPLPGDWLFEIDTDGSVGTSGGTGSELLPWSATAAPAGFLAAESNPAEFDWSVEMRIPRTIFPDPVNPEVFRIRINHEYWPTIGSPADYGWPDNTAFITPNSWEDVIIDLTLAPLPDNQNPVVYGQAYRGDTPTFWLRGRASDDVDIERIDLILDGEVVMSCPFDGAGDVYTAYSDCTMAAPYELGIHRFQALAVDQAGRESRSAFDSYVYTRDGEPPRVDVTFEPPVPALGQPVTIRAVASDPSGISQIMIRNKYGSDFELCPFPAEPTEAECVLSAFMPHPAARMLKFDALATDAEDFVTDSVDRTLVIGNTGPDSDEDGLADDIEAHLCTDPGLIDSDFDGLRDGWEVIGIDFSDGLSPLREEVNPCYRDALLQLDYEAGVRPPDSAIDTLMARARENRVRMHIELNERPRPTAYANSHLNHENARYLQQDEAYYFDPRRNWTHYYGYANWTQGRSGGAPGSFTVDSLGGTRGFCLGGRRPGGKCSTDYQCGIGGSCVAGCADGDRKGDACTDSTDCENDDGSFANCDIPCQCVPGPGSPPSCGAPPMGVPACNRDSTNRSTYEFVHEFGHALGLGHGGQQGDRNPELQDGYLRTTSDWDSNNYKPHHQSIMNYLYSGEWCFVPGAGSSPPAIQQRRNFTNRSTGVLNETALSELASHPVLTEIAGRDCSWAAPDAVPILFYSCLIEEAGTPVKYMIASDTQQVVAMQRDSSSWRFDSLLSHPPGVDWNCDGAIDASVSTNINGPGVGGDSFLDDPWVIEDVSMVSRSEWSRLPNRPQCLVSYRIDCDAPEDSCYRYPQDYTDAMGQLAGGHDPPDCRAFELARRRCPEIDESEFGAGICPDLAELDTPLAAAVGGDGNALAARVLRAGQASQVEPANAGLANEDPEQQRVAPMPNTEYCNLADDDEDGFVDEGCADSDGDDFPDVIDNCPDLPNDQTDGDADGLGDDCQFPAVLQLQAMMTGPTEVTLTWGSNGIPLQGYTVYRVSEADPTPVYLGQSYPATTDTPFIDSVGSSGSYTYFVHPVDLLGREAAPAGVAIEITVAQVIFEDGFES